MNAPRNLMGFLRRHWLALIGSVPVLRELWRWVKWALEWAEHTEFVGHHLHDFWRLWAMIPEPPPIANFFLLVTGGTAIWWDLKRSQRNTKVSLSVPPTKEDTRQWLSSYAIFEFADAKLMRSAEKAERNVQNLEEEYQKLEQERRNRMPQRPMGTMGGPAPEPTSEAFEALAESAATAFNRAQAEKNVRDRARRKALDDLYDKLSTGTLIAKGFHDPIGNRGEVEIPPSEWRILRFNGDYTEAQGRGLKYIGIAVAKTAFKVE